MGSPSSLRGRNACARSHAEFSPMHSGDCRGGATMQLLLDACVWSGAVEELRAAGHDVIYAADWSPDPGDEEILRRAHEQSRVLITLDRDFGELAAIRGQ